MLCVPGQCNDGESALSRVVVAHAVVDIYPLLGAPGGGGEVGVGVERRGLQVAAAVIMAVITRERSLFFLIVV